MFLHRKAFTSIDYSHPTLRRMVKQWYISSNITISLEQRSFLMLVSPVGLSDTGNRFQEILACFDVLPVIPCHAIVFPSFPNLWNEEFSLQHSSKIVQSTIFESVPPVVMRISAPTMSYTQGLCEASERCRTYSFMDTGNSEGIARASGQGATTDKSTAFNLCNPWQWGPLNCPRISLGSGLALGLVLNESKSLQLQEH